MSTIMVVDDDDLYRACVVEMVSRTGCDVLEASGGSQALHLLENCRPSGVILDLLMPELDGFQVMDAVRRSERLRNLPIIVLTAKDLSRAELDFLAGRGATVLSKGPESRESLIAALAKPRGERS